MEFANLALLFIYLMLDTSRCFKVPDQTYKNNPLAYPKLEINDLRENRFNARVLSIRQSPTKAELLISDENSIWLINLAKIRSERRVAGNNAAGYEEHIGVAARFNIPSAVETFNSSHAIVADRENHCLRLVDLFTGLTSRYVGECEAPGDVSGNRLTSRLRQPTDVLHYSNGFFLFTDYNNNAVKLLVGNRVSEFFVGIPVLRPSFMAFIALDLYVTVEHAVVKIDTLTKQASVVTGYVGRLGGRIDGPIKTSTFNGPTGILAINDHTLLVADTNNQKLRHIDLANGKVDSICSGLKGFKDDLKRNCQLNQPRSLFDDDNANRIYIGEQSGDLRELKVFNDGLGNQKVINPFLATTTASPAQRIEHRITLQVEYNLKCLTFSTNPIVRAAIDAVVHQYGYDLLNLCAGCELASSNLPDLACGKDKLTLAWNTKRTVADNMLTAGMKSTLDNILSKYQTDMTQGGRRFLTLTIPETSNIKIVLPNKNKDGLFITPAIRSTCLHSTMKYDQLRNVCIPK